MPAVFVRVSFKPTSFIRDAPTPAVDCRPPGVRMTYLGRWKQRSGGEATHLPFVQVLIGPHGISGFGRHAAACRLFLRHGGGMNAAVNSDTCLPCQGRWLSDSEAGEVIWILFNLSVSLMADSTPKRGAAENTCRNFLRL